MSDLDLRKGDLLYANPETGVSIYTGLIVPTQVQVAIKQTHFPTAQSANRALKEAFAMSALSHTGIVKIYDCFFEAEEGGYSISLVTELMKTDLEKEIQRRKETTKYWTEMEILGIMRVLVSSLSYAEAKGYSHRDIKPQNIFVSEWDVKIGDFGAVARNVEPGVVKRSIQGTPFYLSPELKRAYIEFLQSGNRAVDYDPIKSDVYSLGITLLFMARLTPPIELGDFSRINQETMRLISDLWFYPYLQPLLTSMLQESPASRPTFLQLEQYFQRFERSIIGIVPKAGVGEEAKTHSKTCTECGLASQEFISRDRIPSTVLELVREDEQFCGEKCLQRHFSASESVNCADSENPVRDQAALLSCGHAYHHDCHSPLAHSESLDSAIHCKECEPKGSEKGWQPLRDLVKKVLGKKEEEQEKVQSKDLRYFRILVEGMLRRG